MPKEIIFTFEGKQQQDKFFAQLDKITELTHKYREEAQDDVDTKQFVRPKAFETYGTALRTALQELRAMFNMEDVL